ncbi:MAG TPA: sigma-70 family RNA polymerase sigma factor [Polyangia bacterium]|nr:sigma-70 family RNA polymerase sigma factor [Polyangia bacterium]
MSSGSGSVDRQGAPAEGDPQAVAALGAKFVPQTLRYLGVPDGALLDAAQDVLVVALRRLADFEHRSTLQTWLYGICIRVAQEYRRKHANRREILVEALPELTAAPAQESAVEKAEWRKSLRRVLDTLSEQQREAFVLFEIQRLSMKEVAEALGCPLKTAYFRHKAARVRVLEEFKRRAAESDSEGES